MPKSHLTRHVPHDTTRHVWRVESMHFGCRACRTAQLDTLDTMSSTGSTRNYVCCIICIKLWYASYSLIYWSTHLFNSCHLGEQDLCMQEHKTTTLVQTSTKACSSPAMLEQHGSHAHLDSLDTSNVLRYDEPSGIWARLHPTYTNLNKGH